MTMCDSSSTSFRILELILYSAIIGDIILIFLFAKSHAFQYAISFGAVALAILALIVSFRSKRIAVDSANANFLSVLSIFEDKRIDLQYDQRAIRLHRVEIWKCLIYMREANELLDFCEIKPKHQRRLINLFNKLLELVNNSYLQVLVCEEVEHLLDMYKIGLDLDDGLATEKDTMREHIRQLMEEPENIEINVEYIDGIYRHITDDIYNLRFHPMRDQIKEWYWSTIDV